MKTPLQEALPIEVALGAWVNRYVKLEALPEGLSPVEGSAHVYRLSIDASTTPMHIVQKMKIPQEELGVMLFLGRRIFLDTKLLELAQSNVDQDNLVPPKLWIYPMVIGG